MREDVIKFASSMSVGIGIFSIYLVFLTRCVALSEWSYLSQLETAILVTQIIRVTVVFGLGKVLRIQPLFSIILFSFEAFLIPFLALIVIWTNDPYYATLMGAILTTWIGVSAIVLSPYAIYEFAKSMVKENSLPSVTVIAALEVGGMLFLSGVLATTDTTIQGPSALGTLLLQQFGKSQVSGIGFAGLASNNFVAFGLVIFYVGMISYLALGVHGIGSKIRISDALLLPLAGTMVAVIWAFVFFGISSDVLFAFTIPTVVGVATLWGTSRGN